ncbi:flavoprotein [Rathayibacter toxicus]|uniref:flavoprotein n=1 Tax=Rathayibacter toxicus TaxID=145458 RepID=UPI000CE77983|nr:flavoprotein [Rathayibacter toxicus]PPI56827.1 hypothetical protein C5D35_00855 [Rathayibacter toxicus]QOD10406.1 hypothetical protein BSG36_11005 [Rathayibacter toxicus]QWL29076.1 hypothetical protein E2R33_11000 [Rathayibacter toxicus]
MLHTYSVCLVLTGAIQTSFTPSAIFALKARLPRVKLSIAFSAAAQRFLTKDTVRALGVDEIVIDEWDLWSSQTHHVDLAQRIDAFIIYPASLNYVSQLSAGMATGPVLLALQCTSAPIVVCPSFPEGAYKNEIVKRNLRRLTERGNITVMPPHRGKSAWTGQEFVGAVGDIDEAITCVEAEWAIDDSERIVQRGG